MKIDSKVTKLLENSNVPEHAIWWYTRDGFLYRLFNKTFRHQAEDIIFQRHFFVADVYKQLKRECTIETYKNVCTYYRSQLMLKEKIEKLHRDRGSYSL